MRPKEERQARGYSAAELGGPASAVAHLERPAASWPAARAALAGYDTSSPHAGLPAAPAHPVAAVPTGAVPTGAVPTGAVPAPAARAAAAAPSFHDSWVAALTAAEVDVDAAEDLLRRLHEGEDVDPVLPGPAWPGGQGPIPVEFAERARLLLRRQLQVSEKLTAAMLHTRTELNALKKLDPAEQRPIFFDQAL